MILDFVRQALRHRDSLSGQAIRGGIWLAGGGIYVKGLSFLKIIILARLLSPDDFGRVAIAVTVLTGFDNCTNPGFRNAMVQTKEDVYPYLNAIWTLQMLRGIGLALVIVSGAPLVAWFFGNQEVIPIVQVLAFVAIGRGMVNPATILLRKNLDFQREVIWKLLAATAGFVAAITLGILYRNAWALVGSVLVTQLAEIVLSYWIIPYRPRGSLDFGKMRALMKVGRSYFWLQLTSYLTLFIDTLAVGKIFGIGQVGLYQMAIQIAKEPITLVGSYVHGVAFPAFAKLHDKEELRSGFIRTITAISSMVIPLGIGLAVFSGYLVKPILGATWLPIVPLVSVLALAGTASAIRSAGDALLQGMGRPDLSLQSTLIHIGTLAIGIYPMARLYGITGVAVIVTISHFLAAFVELTMCARLVGTSTGRIVQALVDGGLHPFCWIHKMRVG